MRALERRGREGVGRERGCVWECEERESEATASTWPMAVSERGKAEASRSQVLKSMQPGKTLAVGLNYKDVTRNLTTNRIKSLGVSGALQNINCFLQVLNLLR